MKKCNECGVPKPFTSYAKRTKSLDGLQHKCRDCIKERDKGRDRSSYWRQATYGLSDLVYAKMLEEQNGCCAICDTTFTDEEVPNIDHVPGTEPKVVRSLLCRKCNTGLGQFKDDARICQKAAVYLAQHFLDSLT